MGDPNHVKELRRPRILRSAKFEHNLAHEDGSQSDLRTKSIMSANPKGSIFSE